MSRFLVTPARPADYTAILELNEDAIPHVNSIPFSKLEHLSDQSIYFSVARHDDSVAAFLLVLPETADYDSINFGYFRDRYPRFAYVDRIVVSAPHRGSGLGGMLYEDLARLLPADCPLITCEVNVRPPNEASLRFHQRMGFEAVGEQDTEGGLKRVCLMTKKR